MSIGLWVRGARPKTLATSIASVMVGATMAYAHIEQSGTCIAIYPEPASCATAREQQTLLMDRFWPVTILCLLVALFLQIAVNYANDYSDGIRGTDAGRDTDESKSGKPQRLTASGLVPAKHVLFAAMICAAIACIWLSCIQNTLFSIRINLFMAFMAVSILAPTPKKNTFLAP